MTRKELKIIKDLPQFIGGNLEVQGLNEDKNDYAIRGPIKNITVTDKEICVEFDWLAKDYDTSKDENIWVKTDLVPYVIALELYSVNKYEDMVALHSNVTKEMVVFFPKGKHVLNPADVAGLTV